MRADNLPNDGKVSMRNNIAEGRSMEKLLFGILRDRSRPTRIRSGPTPKNQNKNNDMKKYMTFCAVALLAGPAAHGELIPNAIEVVDIRAHHQGEPSGNGNIIKVVDGSGLTVTDPEDSATWTQSTTAWQDMWHGNISGPDAGAEGWVVFDLGAEYNLDKMYIWNGNQGGAEGTSPHIWKGVGTYNLYYATSPTVSLPANSSTITPYDFTSGGWTQFGTTQTLTAGTGAAGSPVNGTVDLAGVTARYVAMDVLSRINVTTGRFQNQVGLSEVVFTELPVPPQPERFQLIITPNETPGLYDFEWDSKPGKAYDLLTSTDLATPISTWPVYDPDGEGGNPPYAGIPTAGTMTTLTAVPGDGTKRFFAVAEKDAPPLFTWDFEADGGGFTQVGTPNDWSWGMPNSDNSFGLALTTGNEGSTGAWATNLGTGGSPSGLIDPAANSILRSPDIDLTAVTGAQLGFAAAYDAKAGDVIEVLVRDAGSDALLDTITPIDTASDASSDWTTLGPFDLSSADNTNIYLEFRYDGSDANYIGLYLDDVVVTQN